MLSHTKSAHIGDGAVRTARLQTLEGAGVRLKLARLELLRGDTEQEGARRVRGAGGHLRDRWRTAAITCRTDASRLHRIEGRRICGTLIWHLPYGAYGQGCSAK